MAEFTNTLDPAISDNVTENLLQSNMNSRLDWLDTSEVDFTEEELVVESVVDEIIVDQEENVDYIECLNVEECVEESIVYVFDESVVEFDINEPTYIIQADPSFLLEEEVVETINSEDPDASDIMMNSNMEGISIRETGQLDFSDDCVELVNICSEVVNVSGSTSDEINKGDENVVSEINSTTVGEVNNAQIQKSQIYNFGYNTSGSGYKMADFESKQSESTCKPPEIDSKITEFNIQVLKSDNKNVGLIFNNPEISQISEFNEIQLLNSPNRVTEPSIPSFTPPNMLASILNKSNFGQMSPISPDLLSDKTSPSSTTSENTSSPTINRTAVLGREQIKKRLQSFSLFKQGIHALPIKKVLTVKPPKVHVHTTEELDENGKKKIIIMKKPPKQGTNAQEKAKSVIDEIEQIKRDEAMAMGQQFGYNHGYLKHSLSNLHSTKAYDHLSSRKTKPSVDRDSLDRSSSSKNHDKSYRNTKRYDRDREHSRSYRHKSEEVHDKKKSEHRHRSEDDNEKKKDKDDAMQNYWNEVKKKYNEHKKLSQPKEKSVEKSTKIEELKDKYKDDDKHKEEDNFKKDDKYKKGDKYKEERKYKKEDKNKEEDKYIRDDKYKEEDRYKKDEKHKEDERYKKEEKYKEEDKYKRVDGFKEEERYKKEEKYRQEENNRKDDKCKDEEKIKKDDKYKEDDRCRKDDRYKEDERLKKEDILKEDVRYKKELKYKEETKYKKEQKEEEMPADWYDMKKKNIDFNQISKIKEKTMKISIEDTPNRFEEDGNKVVMYKREDYIKPQLIFEYPSLPRHPIVALSIAGKSKYYPPEIVRFTEKHPFLSYCEKPQNARGYYRTRKQTFNEIPHDRMDTMLQIIENKTESSHPLNLVIPDWYPAHDYLIESKLKALVELEPKPITSYGLSVLSENYNDDEELETLVEELLEEAIQPEKKIEEFSKSEKKESEHRSKNEKKRKKKHKKSKSRSLSKEKSEYRKSKKHEEEDEHGKSSEKPIDRSSEKFSDRSSEKYRERSAEKSRERSSEKSRERSSEKSMEGSLEKSRDRFSEKPRELSSEKSKERSHKSREGSLEKSRERSSDKFRERSFDKSRERFPEQTREESIEKCRDRSAEKSRARSSEKSKERSQRSREISSDKSRARSRERSSEKLRETPSDKSTARFAEKSVGSSEKIIDRSFEKTTEELEKRAKFSEKSPEKYVKQLEHFPEKEKPLEKQKLLEKPKIFEDIFDVPTEKELLDDKTPNTDEYRSNWESDEDVLNEILREDIPYCKSYPLERKWEIEELHPRYEDKRNRRRKSSERISEERNRKRTDEKRKHRNSYEETLSEFEHKRSNEFKQVEDKSYQPEYNNRWSSEEDLNKLTKYDKKRYVSNEKSSKPRKSRGTDGLLKLTPSVRRTNWSSDEEFDRKNSICEFEKRNKLNVEDRKYSKRDSEPRNSFKVKPDSRWEEEHKQLESKFRYDDLFGKDFLNLKNYDRKHKHSEERTRSSDESSRKKKKDEKKKVEKEKKKKYKEKGKAPKVQINYSDLEDNLDEEFRSVEKKNDFFKTEDKFARYKAKIKIDYSDFDMSLIESTDNYKRKFEDIKAAPEEEKVEEIKKIIPKVDRIQKKIEVENFIAPPKEATNIKVKIKEEIISPPKPITTTLVLESLTPLAPPPVLPIPVPFSSVSKPETSSKLASEYEEFMKAVSFDEAPTESLKSPKDSKLGITKLEIPPSTPKEESLKEDTSSDSESESSESELSESSYESSDIDLDLTLANIKTEKISDSELEAELPQSKRKRVDSDLEVFNPDIKIKSEKNLFENDDAKFNVIDWENSYTETNTYFDIFTNKKIKANMAPLRNPIIDITEIIAPIVLPENIPLPSDEIIASPKESIISVTDSQNSTPIKKLRSLIPIKLLTPEHRLKAIETAKLEEEVIVIDEKTNQSVVSSSDGYNKDELDDLELRECRKRQSNWNLNITPSKKPLLQTSALCDDSDEDFTDKLSKSPEKIFKKLGTNVSPEVLNREAIVIEDSPVKQLRQTDQELTKSKEGIFTEKAGFETSNFNQSGLEKSRFDKFSFECSKIENSSVQHPENKFGLEKSISVGKFDIKKSPDRKSISRLDLKKTPVRFNRERVERSDDRKRELSRERSRDRTKRKVPDRRDRRQIPRGRSRYSRERETKLRGRNSRDRSRDRAHSRENERKFKGQENKSLKSSRWDDHRQITRSPSPKMNSRSSLERIPIPVRLDDTDFSATSMDIVQSPVNSPLDGFKRSLADSTISDSELITQLNTPEESNEPSPRYQQPYSNLKELPKTESPCSPKRISLDDRINLVLGIDKELPKQIDTVCTRGPFQHPPPNYHPDSYGYAGRSDYDMYNQPGQSDNFGTYSNQYHQQTYYPSQLNSDNNIKVVQVGNMIQVVPTEHLTPPSPVAPPVPKVQEAQTKVVQVGNMLQIVPMTIEPHIVAPTLSPMLPVPAEKVIVSSAPSKSTETLVAERRAEKDKRRKEREQRRIEKEKKQKEKEKRKQLKIKIKTENMIKRALMLETGEGDMDISNIENEEEEKDGVLSLPWPPASSLVTLPLPKPPSKGILVTHGFKKEKDDSSDEYTEVRKVKFADGICPGEGTSPSGGEELPSPPPPPRKLPKEKRYKKMKNKNKKKIKVKIIRTQQPPVEEEDESEDNLPPPPPPPGSPPPHLWPPRIKPHINNIHPSLPPNVYPPNPYPAPPPQMYPAAYNGPTQPPPIVMGHGQPPHPQQTIRHHPPAIPIIQPHGGAPPQLPLHHGLHHGAPFHH